MLKVVEETIVLLKENLSREFSDFQGLYLFGLYIDGKFHDDEDIEIAAVFDSEDKEKRQLIWKIVGKIEEQLGVCIDLYPTTKSALENDDTFFDEVVNQGIFYKV